MDIPDRVQICRVGGLCVISDAQITDEEHAFLQRLMDRYGLDEQERPVRLEDSGGGDAVYMVVKPYCHTRA